MRIKPFTSFALDVLRVGAALGVVISHLGLTKLVPDFRFSNGHLFVVCFFVLSGFVIVATSDPQRMTPPRYFSLRLARLWTVALPCLACTLILEILGRHFAPDHYALFSRGSGAGNLARYGLTAFFLNESGFWSAGPPSNSPVWSLPYEAWYYAIFGVAIFVRPATKRYGLLLLFAILAGPRILLMMPIWLLGGLIWNLSKNPRSVFPWRWPILSISILLSAYMIWFQPQYPDALGTKPLFFSAMWISDFIFGCAVAGIILSVDLIWGEINVPHALGRLIKEISEVSFTLYLLHFPLMVFASGFIHYDSTNLLQISIVLTVIASVIYGVGKFTEPQRKPFSLWLGKVVFKSA